jgi:hypothetical protein
LRKGFTERFGSRGGRRPRSPAVVALEAREFREEERREEEEERREEEEERATIESV